MSIRLALGTVQFGLNYGINNKLGQVPENEISRILNYCKDKGINTIDTAFTYGNSENVLGRHDLNDFNIISKFPGINAESKPEEIFHLSLSNLKVNSLYGYLFHSFDTYLQKPELLELFSKLKKEGTVKKIGFSLYTTEQLDYLINNKVEFDIIQVPFNIFDQRFAKYFKLLKDKNIEIHIRSVFLQGLFFMHPENLNPYFMEVKSRLQKLNVVSISHKFSIQDIAIGFVKSFNAIDKIVLGIDSLNQLKENYNSYMREINGIDLAWSDLEVKDERIINPSLWLK